MRSGIMVCAALAFGILASPLSAQTTPPEQPNTPAQQTTPQDTAPLPQQPQFPPAKPTNRHVTTGEAPPPFPPMPRHRPPSHRFVDLGGSHRSTSTHHATTSRHHVMSETKATHVSSKTERFCQSLSHRKAERNAKCKALRREEGKAAAPRHQVHASPKTIRFCHKLTYREILRHSDCEALLRNDLENQSARHERKTRRHATERKSTSHHRHTSEHKATPHHRHHR